MKTKKSAARSRNTAKLKANRKLHKRVLLHPSTVFILLCVGVLLVGWTWKANASGTSDNLSYDVHARIPAPPLTEPALITNPATGKHFDSKPINVIGTCPNDSYVKLYRNFVFSGVANCIAGKFVIETDLFDGANSLQAQDFNITDDIGPAGNTVVVYYDAPEPVAAPSGSVQNPPATPLLITTDLNYTGYMVGQSAHWDIKTTGGNAPYGFTVDWGDGRHDTYALKSEGILRMEHVYKSAKDYVIKVQVSDSTHNEAFLQLIAIVRGSGPLISIGGSTININPNPKTGWTALIWPAYAIVALMTFSYWLGEREEYWLITHPKRPAKRRLRYR